MRKRSISISFTLKKSLSVIQVKSVVRTEYSVSPLGECCRKLLHYSKQKYYWYKMIIRYYQRQLDVFTGKQSLCLPTPNRIISIKPWNVALFMSQLQTAHLWECSQPGGQKRNFRFFKKILLFCTPVWLHSHRRARGLLIFFFLWYDLNFYIHWSIQVC